MLLDVKHFVEKKKEELKADSSKTVAIVEIGENRFDQMFVKGLERDCKDVGDRVVLLKFSANADLDVVKDCMRTVIEEDADGMIVTCYSPHAEELEMLIPEEKDLDKYNLMGLMEYLKSMTDLQDKTVVIVGEGGPLIQMLINEGAKVISYNANTEDLKKITQSGDIVISAAGVKGLIKKDMVKKGAIVIDAVLGIDEDGEYGDCDEEMHDPNDSRFAVTTVKEGVGLLIRLGVLEGLHRVRENENLCNTP